MFLLRNLSRGKGVGFFDHYGFYPDFILWIRAGDEQRIVFVEPHGVEHAMAADMDDRVSLSERLRRLSGDYRGKGAKPVRLSMDAFMLAADKDFHELREHYGASYGEGELKARHILPFTEARAAEAIIELFRPPGAPTIP